MDRLEYKKTKELGSGKYGSVFEARTKAGEKIAVKVYETSASYRETTGIPELPEIDFARRVKHPFVVRYLATVVADGRFELAMEMGEPLEEAVEKAKRLAPAAREKQLVTWAYQAVAAVDFLERNGIHHCDTKQDNFLVVGGTLKLADFGTHYRSYTDERRSVYCQGDVYRPPPGAFPGAKLDADGRELIGFRELGEWALGSFLFWLFSAEGPDYAQFSNAVKFEMARGRNFDFWRRDPVAFRAFLAGFFPDKYHALVLRFLSPEPGARTNTGEALRDPLFAKYGLGGPVDGQISDYLFAYGDAALARVAAQDGWRDFCARGLAAVKALASFSNFALADYALALDLFYRGVIEAIEPNFEVLAAVAVVMAGKLESYNMYPIDMATALKVPAGDARNFVGRVVATELALAKLWNGKLKSNTVFTYSHTKAGLEAALAKAQDPEAYLRRGPRALAAESGGRTSAAQAAPPTEYRATRNLRVK